MKVLVTGGAGFLGSHLVDRLLSEQHAVDVVDDLSSGSLAHLADARGRGAELKFHHLDAAGADMAELMAFRSPEVVVHLAAFTGTGADIDEAGQAVTCLLVVAEAARRAGVTKLVTAVPAADLYGPLAAREVPVKEARGFQPADVVGVAARTVIDLLDVYRERHALEFTVLALGDVYGPRQRDGSSPASRLIGGVRRSPERPPPDPGRTLDLVYVDDTVDAFVRALGRGGGLVVNVGTGMQSTVADVVRAVRGTDDTGGLSRSMVTPMRFALSPMRARIHLSWAPWTSLPEGLANLAARS